jgi:uncharacterized protein (UPF0297 family)
MKQQKKQAGISIFYSYAHEDELLRQQLEKHLAVLRRQGLISEWYDRQIIAGTEWVHEIDTHLETASIILLLVSPDFIASDYCYESEMNRAIERHKAGEALVIPIILRPVDWHGSPFGNLQALPKDGKPVTSWTNRDEAFLDIAEGLRRVIEQQQTFDQLVEPSHRLEDRRGYGASGQALYAAIFEQSSGPARKVRYGLASWQFQQTFDQLTDQGYRLVDMSTYVVNGQALYAAIFEQSSGPAWISRGGLTSEQFQQTFDQLTEQGYRLIDVNGYGLNGQALYAAIFEQSKGPARKVCHGLTSEQFQQTFDQLTDQGYRLVVQNVYFVNGQTLSAGIFEQSSGSYWVAHADLTPEQFQQTFDQLTDQGYQLIDVNGYAVNGQTLYAAIFEQSKGPARKVRYGLTSEQFQWTLDQLIDQGYRLLQLCGYGV